MPLSSYGDYVPKSNIGKPFFVVWSLIAVPIVTVLVQEMARTVVTAVNRGIFKVAEWTVLPKEGVVRDFLDTHPALRATLTHISTRRQKRKRIARGIQVQIPGDPGLAARHGDGNDTDVERGERGESFREAAQAAKAKSKSKAKADEAARIRGMSIFDSPEASADADADANTPQAKDADDGQNEGGGAEADAEGREREPMTSLERLAAEHDAEHDLARQLAWAIKSVAHDLRAKPPRRYPYEQWVHFTQLIRFSRRTREEVARIEEEDGLVEWDWIGEDSPMLADITEAEWLLDRLCESLNRYMRRQEHKVR